METSKEATVLCLYYHNVCANFTKITINERVWDEREVKDEGRTHTAALFILSKQLTVELLWTTGRPLEDATYQFGNLNSLELRGDQRSFLVLLIE